ncbi:hypothetical protein [Dyella solisilvae]|uniref:hypothetical protein n=1 Tax=Dyella solisilvae TaxID=1920168 RepID=UPI001314CEFF|nr:hypothetical protein [Dyella solisilvae]
MSLIATPARMYSAPVNTGRVPLHTSVITISAMTTTTTTITTGSGWESVRE